MICTCKGAMESKVRDENWTIDEEKYTLKNIPYYVCLSCKKEMHDQKVKEQVMEMKQFMTKQKTKFIDYSTL